VKARVAGIVVQDSFRLATRHIAFGPAMDEFLAWLLQHYADDSGCGREFRQSPQKRNGVFYFRRG